MSDEWPLGEYVGIPITRHPDPDNSARRMRTEIVRLRDQVQSLTVRADNALKSAALANEAAAQANLERAHAHTELDDLTALNDRLQDDQRGHMCRIDELEQELIEQGQTVAELRRTVAELRGTR